MKSNRTVDSNPVTDAGSKKEFIGLRTALNRMLSRLPRPTRKRFSLLACTGLVAAESATAMVDSPPVDVSMKDGYAIRAADVRLATGENPVQLSVRGLLGAGDQSPVALGAGTALRILTGARIPADADTVVADEFVTRVGDSILISKTESRGRNILPAGSDIVRGESLVSAGKLLTPGNIGLLAAGGISEITVFCRPKVGLIASGDEILLPGSPPGEGKIYASNLLTLNSWCCRFGLATEVYHSPDEESRLKETIGRAGHENDALITSGGAWTGDRDLTGRVLNLLGWEKVFHRVRLGPGKAVGFGLWEGKPVFVLPGGPPSNLVAFLQVVLPALRKLSGHDDILLPRIKTTIDQTVEGQSDWVQAIFGCLRRDNGNIVFSPVKNFSRLKKMAVAEALLLIPEGVSRFETGAEVHVQLLE